MIRRLAALAACALAGSAALADDAPARWYLQLDNDVVLGTDRWYTSGVRLARVARLGGREVELAMQQDVYTPDVKGFEPGRVEREPAARLYAALASHDRTPTRHVTLEGTLGVRGPAAQGEEALRLVHRLVPARFVDWTRQDPHNRVEAQATYSRSDAFGRVVVHHGAVAGTMTAFAHAGAEWRLGDEPAAAASSTLLRFAPTPPWGAVAASGWSAFLGASVRYVASNHILEDAYDVGTPRSRRLEMERGIARAAAGVTWVQDWGSIVFGVAVDSREFAQQRSPHRFGSLAVHVPF